MRIALGMIALFPLKLQAEIPPEVIIEIFPEEVENPFEEPLDLIVHFNTATGLLLVETYVNQWLMVYIFDTDTGFVYSVDAIDPLQNYDSIYYTYAPSLPGNYCILFQSGSSEARGYFTIQ